MCMLMVVYSLDFRVWQSSLMKMAIECENQESLYKNLRQHLALAVRSRQWSYGIFWSISTAQPGVLEWRFGYYNGDTRIRKRFQNIELDAERINTNRSDQLRELYESLVAAETNSQGNKRLLASLSPEDLSDTEWYYLVSMSFVFNVGQGLPGRTLASRKPIWLCNADIADSQFFTRTLLAKSASIQTVVCLPYFGGVVELGATDQVQEDASFIEPIQCSLLEIIDPTDAIPSTGSRHPETYTSELDNEVLVTKVDPVLKVEELDMVSANNSIELKLDSNQEDSFMIESINGRTSQTKSWKIMDEDVIYHVNDSDCMSQTFVDPEKVVLSSTIEMISNHLLLDLEDDDNPKRLESWRIQTNNEVQYRNVLSSLIKSSDQLVLGQHFENYNKESSFKKWKEDGSTRTLKSDVQFSQRLLKKVLTEGSKIQGGCLSDLQKKDWKKNEVLRPEAEANQALPRQGQGQKLDENFMVLRSLIPCKNKADEVSVLDETIQYMKVLERKVKQLEEQKTSEAATKRQPDAVEKTSDNYGTFKILTKRKACNIDETKDNTNQSLPKDSFIGNVNVSITEKNVTIVMHCPWRECLMFEAVDALSNLNLDSHSVESSIVDGIISLTMKSVLRGSSSWSATMIRQVLQKIVEGCKHS